MKTTKQTEFEKTVLDQFMSGKNLFGKDGAFAPMLKNVIEKALEAEMEGHLDEIERFQGNKRNGRGKKTGSTQALNCRVMSAAFMPGATTIAARRPLFSF